jgi:hypothetical protein
MGAELGVFIDPGQQAVRMTRRKTEALLYSFTIGA